MILHYWWAYWMKRRYFDGVFGKKTKSMETIRRVKMTCELAVEILGQEFDLDKASHEDVAYLLEEVGKRRKTPGSFNTTIKTMRLMFRDAAKFGREEWKLHPESPLCALETVREPRTLPQFMGLDTTESVMRFLGTFVHGTGPLLALLCGLRLKEARGLTWDDIVAVKGEATPAQIRITGDLGKGGNERVIPMPAKLFAKAKAIRAGAGELVSPEDPDDGWRMAKQAIRFSEPKLWPDCDVTFHGLRHSCARWYYYRAGMQIAALRDFLGHTDIKTTMRYLEGGNENTDKQVAQVDGVLG